MKRASTFITAVSILCITAPGAAQEDKEPQAKKGDQNLMISPTERELNDDDKKSLRTTLEKNLVTVVESCVASYPRPEFFTTLTVQFVLRKSGDLRGGYVSSGAVDSNLYVKSDDERAKLEEQGSFARLVVRSDRDLERCLAKGTREFETDLNRVSGRVAASYAVKWKGKKAKISATTFEVSK